MLASTFSRPRWAMPMTNSLTPSAGPFSMIASSIGMSVSPPSSENRFWPTYLVCRNFSKSSAWWSVMRVRYFCWRPKREAVADRLHALGQPVADVERIDVHELDADRAAVGVFEGLDQFAELDRPVDAADERPIHRPVEVGLGQAECSRARSGQGGGRRGRERVDRGLEVPGLAVPEDEPHDAGLEAQIGRRGGSRGRGGRDAIEFAGELHARRRRRARSHPPTGDCRASGGTSHP